MSITVPQSPELFAPVYNPMRFVLSSTNSSQPNFKYVVDVHTSGVTGYTRLLYSGDPVNGRCAPDVSRVLESYISYDLTETNEFERCPNSYKAYQVKFGEQYGPSSGIVTYPNLIETGTKYAWNGVLSHLQYVTYDYTVYTIGGSGSFLTAQPEDLYINSTSNERDTLYFINDTSGVAYFVQGKVFDSGGNEISRFRLENPYQASATYQDKLLKVGVGGYNIQSWVGIILVSGDPLTTNATGAAYYEICTIDFAGNETSSVYTYNIDCETRRGLDPVTLTWLNKLGGFDRFNFVLNRREASEIKRDSFQKNVGTFDSATPGWGYTMQDRGDTIYNTEIKDSILLSSDWISNQQSAWLQDLFESPEVYIRDFSGWFVPVNVKQTRYDKKHTGVDKLFNIEIEVTYSKKRWTQRG